VNFKLRRQKNARIEKLDPGIQKILPRWCRSDESPVPFCEGRMTIAAESDFQSRPAILRINQASLFNQLSVRGRHLNLEHRRVNLKTAG